MEERGGQDDSDVDNSDNDNSDNSDFGAFEEEEFAASTLLINHRLVDDLFCGRSSKDIWSRAEGEEEKAFTFTEEAAIYLVHYVKPRLQQLLGSHRNKRLYIYMASEIQYYLLKDPEEYCSRWSSLRNQHFVAPEMLTEAEIRDWIKSFCRLFVEETERDIDEMESLQGSSWVYSHIRQFHLRHIIAQPSNILSFGARAKSASDFSEAAKKVFSNQVLDPKNFSASRKHANNMCTPVGMALTLLVKLRQLKATALSQSMIEQTLTAISYKSLLDARGIRLSSLPKLEALNKGPFERATLDLFPELSGFSGLAINLFKGKLRNNPPEPPSLVLLPKYLSRHHADQRYFQIDFLIANAEFYKPLERLEHAEHAEEGEPSNKNGFEYKHLLTITDLRKLACRRNPFTKAHVNRYSDLCRKCLRSFPSTLALEAHLSICQTFPAGRPLQPRRCRNTKIYKPVTFNKYTGRTETHYTQYQTRNLHKAVKPLFTSFLDFESISSPIAQNFNGRGELPSNASAESVPFAFALSHTSNYQEIPLPDALCEPRTFYYDPDSQPPSVFYLKLFSTIIEDLKLLGKFLSDVLSSDIGPPSNSELRPEDRSGLLSSHCPICGGRYGSFRLVNGRRVRVTRCRHHHHFLSLNKNIDWICGSCNLNLVCQVSSRIPWSILSHYGSGYDGLYVLFMALEYGTSKMSVTALDEHGNAVTRHRPILRLPPKILLRDSQTILSTTLSLNCFDKSCHHNTELSANAPRGEQSRPQTSSTAQSGPCIFARKIIFLDSWLMLGHSLDQLVKDLAQTGRATNVPLHQSFPNTFSHAKRLNFTDEEAEKYVLSKWKFPFDTMTSFKALTEIVSPPPIGDFNTKLSNSDATIADEDYNHFCWLWDKVQANSLLDMTVKYVASDCFLLSDVVLNFYARLFAATNLYPSFFLTLPQLSLHSALLNARDPLDLTRPLRLPALEEEVSAEFSKGLVGGYASVNCAFSHMTNGMMPQEPTSTASFHDCNALYASVFTNFSIPHSEFRIYDETRNAVHFRHYALKLEQGDSDFFAEQAQYFNYIFFITATLDYDTGSTKYFANNFSAFPQKRCVDISEISRFQRRDMAQKCRQTPANQRLVSSCNKGVISDYASNLFFSFLFMGARVEKVHKVIRCKAFPFLAPYVKSLGEARSKETSVVGGKILKNVANALAGRFHMSVDRLTRAQAITSPHAFDKAVVDDDFYQILPVGSKSGIAIFDGLEIVDRSFPTISSRIYSASKLTIWKMYYQIVARACAIDSSSSTLLLTDTDSILKSSSRPMSRWEETIHSAMEEDVPYDDTPIAGRLAANIFKAWHDVFDYDSEDENSILVKHHFNSPAFKIILRFLAKHTRKRVGLFRQETARPIAHLFAPAPKVYSVETITSDVTLPLRPKAADASLVFPADPTDPLNLIDSTNELKKSKGTKRAILQHKTLLLDYVYASKTSSVSRSIEEFGFRKINFRLFICTRKKRILNSCNIKRLFYAQQKRKLHHLSYPLHFRKFCFL